MAYTEQDWEGILPAATKTKLKALDAELKAKSDILEALTPAEAQAAAEATAALDATAKANAAKSGAEATAAGALAGHVEAADPHTQYQPKEAGKGLSTNNYDDAEKAKMPTSSEKTLLSEIQEAAGTTTSEKITELVPAPAVKILTGLIPPNYDTATKTLSFNSDATYKTMLFYRNTKFDIPVGTTVVDGNSTSAVQLVFDTSSSAFSFIPHGTALSATQIRIAVCKRLVSHYYWDFPGPLTIDGNRWNGTRHTGIISGTAPVNFNFISNLMEFPIGGTWNIHWDNKFYEIIGPVTLDITPPSGLSRGVILFNIYTNTVLVKFSNTLQAIDDPNEILLGAVWVPNRQAWINGNHTIDGAVQLSDLPSYLLSDLDASVEKVLDLSESSSVLSFVAITDTHNMAILSSQIKNHAQAAARGVQDAGLQFAVHLGDTIHGEATKAGAKAHISEIIKKLKDQQMPVLFAKGNHDDNAYYYANEDLVVQANTITRDEWYSRALKPFEDSSTVHDSADPESAYYYRDFSIQKVRVICLDAIDYPIVVADGLLEWNGQNGNGFGDAQITWLATEALDFTSKSTDKANWGVIVIAHTPTRASLNIGAIAPKNGDLVEGVLKAFDTGASYTGSSVVANWEASVSVDFSTQGAIEVIAYFHGHLHADNIQTPADLGWPYIAIANSYNTVASATGQPAGATIPTPRTSGTNLEDCWDLVTINRATKVITLTRYGAGEDRSVSY